MLYVVGAPLPDYRAKACNNGADSTNLIHDDECARHYGFRAGLVPGVSIFAYVSRSLVEFLGEPWLERGFTEVRFIHPLYDGEEVRTAGILSSITKEGTLCIDLQAMNSQGVTCAAGVARLTAQPTGEPEPNPEDYPARDAGPRRPISLESLKVGELLTPIRSEFTRTTHWEYCQKSIRDHHPIYSRVLHPGWLLNQANLILAANYELPPWIHAASVVQNYHFQDSECVVETRGKVRDKFERGGHHFVVLDLVLFASGRCLQSVQHTAIFRIAPRAA
jgi:hypothetical protein